LTDGGVYDNLGLETAWKGYQTLLVSDAGGILNPQGNPRHNWVHHLIRSLYIIDSQVRNLRKRQLLDAFKLNLRHGAYWSIRTNIDSYNLYDAFDCPFEKTTQLASIATRLKRLSPIIQERLINWGYAVCDTAMRKYVDATLTKSLSVPYPAVGVG
jgi:NTE family protein